MLEHAIKKYNPQALITVDLYGQSCEYNDIIKLCDHYGVLVVEDAAEALGSEFNGKKLGVVGDIGIFHLMVIKSSRPLVGVCWYQVMKNMFLKQDFYQCKQGTCLYEHKELGFNYRMSNLLAAVGRGQLLNLDSFVKVEKNFSQIL